MAISVDDFGDWTPRTAPWQADEFACFLVQDVIALQNNF
jgi:hypothetical protein